MGCDYLIKEYQYEVAGIVAYEMTSKGIKPRDLAEVIHQELGLKAGPAYYRIRNILEGIIYGTTSADTRNLPTQRERLSKILYAIGFAENSRTIQIIRKNDDQFKYPPQNAIPYDRIKILIEEMREKLKRIKPTRRILNAERKKLITKLTTLKLDDLNKVSGLVERLQKS